MIDKIIPRKIATAIIISLFTLLILVITAPDIGLTWDEPAYIAASESYTAWFGRAFTEPTRAFNRYVLDDAWHVNNEHPPLDKIWSGAVWTVARNFTDDLLAHRLGNMLLVALLTGLLYLLIYNAYGQIAGFAAVAALLTMPRFFFHAHLSALDVPATVSAFIVTFAFWKTLERPALVSGLFLGLLWGLALATKINAVFVPVTLGLWWLIFRRDWRTLGRLVLMGVTAIPVFFAVWPWLYRDTWARFVAYIEFVTTKHWEIGQYYLGQFYMPPPWHFGFVMIWAVLPLGLTILYFIGIARAGTGKRDSGLAWLLFLGALTPILAISTSQSMVYDNERLVMVTFPFLAGLAGVGFGWLDSVWAKLSERLGKPQFRYAGLALLTVLAFLPQLVTMTRLYPHYLSYYGESVGGLSGAAALGLEATYWCESYKLALPIINEKAIKGDRVWVDPWSHDVLIYYQREGLLRKDIVILNPISVPSILGGSVQGPQASPIERAQWIIFQNHPSAWGDASHEENPLLQYIHTRKSVYQYSFDGVPIMTLYIK